MSCEMPSVFVPKPFTAEELKAIETNSMKLEPMALRALIRQSTHQVENGTQRYVLSPEQTQARMGRAINTLRIALETWDKRGLSNEKGDIKYAREVLKEGERFQKNPVYHDAPPHQPFSENELRVLEKAILERRAIRRFSPREIPDSLLEKVLQAAIWAPAACSLQGPRFFVLKDPAMRNLIIQPWNSPVIIVMGLDESVYDFIKANEAPYNKYLDLGAAIQNMMLTAHALGLGTCLGTFSGELKTMKQALGAPDYISIITYMLIGWPADKPPTMPRIETGSVTYREKWSEK